ncbi:hypothetical protein HY612_04420 [Candidatus Roizmanbacteria bacterium]|nr:hypothetical protein [Candidatus Roizmanbacteria bacterium]
MNPLIEASYINLTRLGVPVEDFIRLMNRGTRGGKIDPTEWTDIGNTALIGFLGFSLLRLFISPIIKETTVSRKAILPLIGTLAGTIYGGYHASQD